MLDALRDLVQREVLRGRHAGPIAADAALITSGLIDSLRLLKLVERVRARFGVRIDLRATPVTAIDTLSDLAAHVRALRDASSGVT